MPSRQRLVRLGRERAERHAGGVEALEDGFHRLDLVQRDRLGASLQLHQVAALHVVIPSLKWWPVST